MRIYPKEYPEPIKFSLAEVFKKASLGGLKTREKLYAGFFAPVPSRRENLQENLSEALFSSILF